MTAWSDQYKPYPAATRFRQKLAWEKSLDLPGKVEMIRNLAVSEECAAELREVAQQGLGRLNQANEWSAETVLPVWNALKLIERRIREQRVAEAAGAGQNKRAVRALELLQKKWLDPDEVLDAFEMGAEFPKRSYVTKYQRYSEWLALQEPDVDPTTLPEQHKFYGVAQELASARAKAKTRRAETEPACADWLTSQPLAHPSQESLSQQCAAKDCVTCFVPGRVTQRFCSSRCRIENRVRRVTHDDRLCEACRSAFTPKNRRAQYCSDRCRVLVWDRRHADVNADTKPIPIQR